MGWPMILIMFFQFAIGLTDAYVAGYLGTNVLAAVGYVGQVYFTLIILANGLTVGTVSMVSQAYGADSSEGVGNVTAHAVCAGIVVSGLMTATASAFPEQLVRFTGMPLEIQGIAVEFVEIFSMVLVPAYVMIISSGVLRASDRVHIAMLNSFISALANVGGDIVLAFGWGPIPALGYQGIAYASAVAITLGMILNMMHLCTGPARITLRKLVSPIPRCVRNLARLGLPSAIQNVAWNTGTLVVYFLVGQLQAGEITALAAMTGGLRFEAIIFLPMFALNMAAAVLTGNRLGRGDTEGAKYGARVTAGLSLAITLVSSTAVFLLAPLIAGLITDDPAVRAEMTRYLRINMVSMPFLAIGVALSGALQGAGDTLATMLIIFTGMWLVRIPAILTSIYLLDAGPPGIWWAMVFSMTVMCLLLILRFKGEGWITASVDKRTRKMLWQACLEKPPGKQ